ncbi:MAG: DUF1292 domain-containing protein [Firmicutes bacterium]|nr:DUF1292 domain-containing protein [Bacillota bacterium]
MDEIKTVILYDEETDTEGKFDMLDSCEVGGKTYWLLAAYVEEDDIDDGEEDGFVESETFLFKVCDEKNAEFEVVDGKKKIYITSAMSDEEFEAAYNIFAESNEYEIEYEEEV